MEIKITGTIKTVDPITAEEFNVLEINSIADRYPDQRQKSKAPTFALTYQGTFSTLMTNCGFSEEEAKNIERQYHELYKVSDDWVREKLLMAEQTGYVLGAFGLRVRTPMLKQSLMRTRATPKQAEAEGRTAGNALGQSYGLLNSRAAMEFMSKVRKSIYRNDIKPCAQIHDAQYYLVRNNPETIEWVNRHLVEAVRWQELPDIQHDEVKLGGQLSIFFPDWATEITVPNGATKKQIKELAKNHARKK